MVLEGVAGCAGKGFSKKESQQLASKLTLEKLKKEPQFIDAVFEAKGKRTKMEEEPVNLVPDTEEKMDFIIPQGNEQQPADQTNNDSDTNASAGDKVEIVTDDKGNIYEIDKETGKILNVTPAPEGGADTDSSQTQE